jgi:aminoglycoside phosphotransferase (APT) family kinase protein
VTAAPDFDPGALAGFLAGAFGPAELALEQVAGGQSNPTYFVTWGGRRMVLRKKPAGPLLPGAHAIEREFRVMEALGRAGVPVPRPLLLHTEPGPLGTPFYLMERVEGRVFADCALAGVPAGERAGIYMGMADALAALHRARPEAVGLGDFGRPGSYFERQIARWTRQWRESGSGPIPALDALADWLPRHLPADDGRVAVAHGDFRLGNLLFHPTEPRVVAILDWELATLGHPLADLGYACIPWHTAPDEYGGILGLDLAALGLPAERAFIERYLAAAPPGAPFGRFHVAFALFRFAAIFVGIADRARAGTAAAGDAAALGPLAARFAERGLEVVSGAQAVG